MKFCSFSFLRFLSGFLELQDTDSDTYITTQMDCVPVTEHARCELSVSHQ